MPLDQHDKIVHLLRRAGFAARPEEIDAAVAQGLAATVDKLLNVKNAVDNLPMLPAPRDEHQKYGSDYLTMTEDNFRYVEHEFLCELNLWWINAMITTTRPLQEKMALFWHHLFATSLDGVPDVRQMYLQNENFRGNFNPGTGQVVRPHLPNPFPLGNFRDMLEVLTTDPAMLFWLDNWTNTRNTPEVGSNENYARELLELFSLGVVDPVTGAPNYTERDLRQASRALTGWTVYVPRDHEPETFPRRFVFDSRPDIHDFGPYQVLGVTFAGDGRRLFDILVQHRNPGQQQSAAGRFLGFRLFKFFGYDIPEPEVINDLADVFDGAHGEARYNIGNLLRRMFTPGNAASEAFYSERAFKAHVKSPTEFVVSIYRLLRPEGLPNTESVLKEFTEGMRTMGQELFRPPNVSGWKQGPNWINTTFYLGRLNHAVQAATERRPQRGGVDVARIYYQNNLQAASREQIVDTFTRLMLQTPVAPEARQTLIDYLNAPSEDEHETNFIHMKVRGLIYLIMATPEFHLS